MARMLRFRGVVIFARGTRKRDVVFTGFQGPGNSWQDEHSQDLFGHWRLVILISKPLFLL